MPNRCYSDLGRWLASHICTTRVGDDGSLSEKRQEWSLDSNVETPTGHSVGHDGVGPDGVPTCLHCLGSI
jgi:hypothetical protein